MTVIEEEAVVCAFRINMLRKKNKENFKFMIGDLIFWKV